MLKNTPLLQLLVIVLVATPQVVFGKQFEIDPIRHWRLIDSRYYTCLCDPLSETDRETVQIINDAITLSENLKGSITINSLVTGETVVWRYQVKKTGSLKDLKLIHYRFD